MDKNKGSGAPRKAMPYYMDALALFEKLGATKGIAIIQINQGELYAMLNMPDSALYFLQHAERLARQNDLEYYLPEILHSEAGMVNISGSTYELITDHFNCRYRGMISTKGKGEVGMYFVLPGA